MHTEVHGRIERLDINGRAGNMMLFGLPEQAAADGEALHHAVCSELSQAAGGDSFEPEAVLEVRRLGAPREDADRPRPALIRYRTVAAKHQAFRSRAALKARGMRLDDCLTPAQMAQRQALLPAMADLRQQQGANPHFRGARLFYWRNGHPVAYTPPRAASAASAAPAGGAQSQPQTHGPAHAPPRATPQPQPSQRGRGGGKGRQARGQRHAGPASSQGRATASRPTGSSAGAAGQGPLPPPPPPPPPPARSRAGGARVPAPPRA